MRAKIFGHSSIGPALVATNLRDGYWRGQAYLAFDRNRFGRMTAYIPSFGLAVAFGPGHFVGEEEMPLSVFFEFPSWLPNDSFRLEAVNDMLLDKDRGPTGGVRLTYVWR